MRPQLRPIKTVKAPSPTYHYDDHESRLKPIGRSEHYNRKMKEIQEAMGIE